MSKPVSPVAEAVRLAAIVESSDDAIIGKDLDGVVTSWNRAAERIFGYTAEEMIGRSITTIIPLGRLDEENEVLTRIRSGRGVDHFETIRRRKDGTLIPISLTVSPILAPDGVVIGASKIARDISERRRAEEALAAAEARQQDLRQRLMALVAGSGLLFESPRLDDVLPAIVKLAQSLVGADGYLIWRFDPTDRAWKIVASAGVSDEYTQKLISVSRAELDSLAQLTAPLAVEDVNSLPMLATLRDSYAAEGIKSLLAVPLTVGGSNNGTLVLYYRARQAFDEADIQVTRAIGHLGAAAITSSELYEEQRRSRDEVTNAFRQASIAGRAKDEFLATLSHELRTPLNAVLGWTRMLRAGTLEPDRVGRAVEVIERNANAQLHLIEDMLDLSRIITGTLRLDARPIALSDPIHAAVETMLPAARAKNIAVKVEGDVFDLVMGDAARLQQVVWNLLSNAVKFTPSGGLITIALGRVDSMIEMEVVDTGEGIDPDVLPFVFDRFRQGDSGTTRAHAGLGLGLGIVRHIVEMHGGRVSVSSAGKGKGATFRIWLPAADDHHQDGALKGRLDNRDHLAPGNIRSQLAGKRALVVDDDPDARELISRMLRTHGMVVNAASSAREGLAALDREMPDIILSDLAMPGEDGYALIRSVRKRPAVSGGLVPAIAVTALATPEDSARSLSSGFQVHLTKPLDPGELFSALERLAVGAPRRAAE